MTFQHLHHLPSLQIPKPNLPILASTHNPFPTRNTEASHDTVLLILMTSIRLEAPSGIVIP